MKTKITPNQITCFETFTFLSFMLLVATGKHVYMIIGAILGVLSVYLDMVDGDLARAKSLTTKLGEFLDSDGFYLEQILIPLSVTSALFI